MLGEATQPLQHNTFVPLAVDYLKADPVTAFLIGGIFTWLIHSSIAALLLIIAFLAQGIIPFDVAVALVLGANVGGALIAVILTREADKTARLVTVGNLCLRGTVAVLLLIAVQIWPIPEKFVEDANIHHLVGFHVGLNLALVVLGLPCPASGTILDKLISQIIGHKWRRGQQTERIRERKDSHTNARPHQYHPRTVISFESSYKKCSSQ